MKRLLLICFLIFGLSSSVSAISLIGSGIVSSGAACSGTYGRTTGESNVSVNSYLIIVTSVTIDCSASAGSIIATLQDAHDATHEVIFLIYDDDGGSGEPGTKVWAGDAMYDAGTEATFADITDTFSALSLTTGNYWIGMLYESTDTETKYRYEATSGQARYYDNVNFTPPETWDYGEDTHSTAERVIWLSF